MCHQPFYLEWRFDTRSDQSVCPIDRHSSLQLTSFVDIVEHWWAKPAVDSQVCQQMFTHFSDPSLPILLFYAIGKDHWTSLVNYRPIFSSSSWVEEWKTIEDDRSMPINTPIEPSIFKNPRGYAKFVVKNGRSFTSSRDARPWQCLQLILIFRRRARRLVLCIVSTTRFSHTIERITANGRTAINFLANTFSSSSQNRQSFIRHDQRISMGTVDQEPTARTQEARILHELLSLPIRERNDSSIPHTVLDRREAMAGHLHRLPNSRRSWDVHITDLHIALYSSAWSEDEDDLQLRERRSTFNSVGDSQWVVRGSLPNCRRWPSEYASITPVHFSRVIGCVFVRTFQWLMSFVLYLAWEETRSVSSIWQWVSSQTFLFHGRFVSSDETIAGFVLYTFTRSNQIWSIDRSAQPNIESSIIDNGLKISLQKRSITRRKGFLHNHQWSRSIEVKTFEHSDFQSQSDQNDSE